jgi:hydrogenase small subunit
MPAQQEEPVVHVLWMNAGLSCDGDSVSLTAATLPSVEEIALGALPGLPKVQFHWPLIDYEVGSDFLRWFFEAEAGRLDPFVFVIEGSLANEKIKSEGYFTGFGNDPDTGQPITLMEWVDRLAPKAWAVVCAGTCATYGGIHAMKGNPTGAMGIPDYLGWKWRSKAGIPVVCVPGCPVQPDNMSETLLYLLHQAAGNAPMIPLDDCLRPQWLFGHQAGLDGRRWRMPQRRRHLHRLHHARFSGQVHAVHGRAAGQQAFHRDHRAGLRSAYPAPALDHSGQR